VVGIADRLDSLVGLFAAGLAPSGTRDPFAQRRTALGLVQALIAWDLDFDIKAGLEVAARTMPIPVSGESLVACFEFISARFQNLLIEKGFRYDIVAAILAEQANNPAAAYKAVVSLGDWVQRSDWHQILPTFARCARITRGLKEEYNLNPAILKEDSERELYAGITSVVTVNRRPGSVPDFFQVFMPIMPVINQFFEDVLVMSEDLAVRANRLGMLQQIVQLAEGVVDFSLLEGF
jgi:glycyl-tRNA synthetase